MDKLLTVTLLLSCCLIIRCESCGPILFFILSVKHLLFLDCHPVFFKARFTSEWYHIQNPVNAGLIQIFFNLQMCFKYEVPSDLSHLRKNC